MSFDKQEAFMAAYRKWIALCESDQFVSYVDWPENSSSSSIMAGCCTVEVSPKQVHESASWFGLRAKHIVDLNYRLLKQRELEQQGITAKWSTHPK